MKKSQILTWALAVCLLACFIGTCFADDSANSSTQKTADAVIKAAPGAVKGILVTADGATACLVELHNDASGTTGAKTLEFNVAAGSADTIGFIGPWVPFTTGIYANMTTTGTCKYEVLFR